MVHTVKGPVINRFNTVGHSKGGSFVPDGVNDQNSPVSIVQNTVDILIMLVTGININMGQFRAGDKSLSPNVRNISGDLNGP